MKVQKIQSNLGQMTISFFFQQKCIEIFFKEFSFTKKTINSLMVALRADYLRWPTVHKSITSPDPCISPLSKGKANWRNAYNTYPESLIKIHQNRKSVNMPIATSIQLFRKRIQPFTKFKKRTWTLPVICTAKHRLLQPKDVYSSVLYTSVVPFQFRQKLAVLEGIRYCMKL